MPDDSAFASLVSACAPALLRVAAALVGSDDAEDAAQEAILRAWRAWPTLRDTRAGRTWLLRIVINVGHAWQRGRFGTDHRLATALPDPGQRVPGALQEFGPGKDGHADEIDLRAALIALPDDLRLIVTLRYFGGMDASEIGEALCLPPATVRTRLRRALATLRDQLQPSDSDAHPAIRPSPPGGHTHV